MALSIFFVLASLVLFHYLVEKDTQGSLDDLLLPLEQWRHNNEKHMAELADKYEEVSEQLVINKLHLTDNKRKTP